MRDYDQSGAKITHLAGYRPVMQDDILLDLLNYWEGLRAGRIAPQRSELDPREFRTALHTSFVLQQTRQGDMRIRLAGVTLCDLMGMELRGMPAHALIDASDREQFNQALGAMIDDPKIVEIGLSLPAPDLKSKAARLLLLPLCDDANRVSRILGALSMQRASTQVPCRFGLENIKETRIVGAQRGTAKSQGFAEPAKAYVPKPPRPPVATATPSDKPTLHAVEGNSAPPPHKSSPRKPHLRLIKNE